jgi:hypothetical protein
MKSLFKEGLLNEMIAEGLIQVQKHPVADLYIYNYTQRVQFDRLWNEVTLACRGLILDGSGRVVARPFEKFFNLGEIAGQHIPDQSFEVFEKMDGSLGILYWLEGNPYIATRGSFVSEQAVRGTQILNNKYPHLLPNLNKEATYLFEIIYPENRIVLDYHGLEDLVLLAVIDNETGRDLPLVEPLLGSIDAKDGATSIPPLGSIDAKDGATSIIYPVLNTSGTGFPIVKRYDGIKDIRNLEKMEEDNKEGFVVKFKDGLRYKVKFEEYLRLHRIITQVSNLSIWEFMRDKKPLDELLDKVPDEFYGWVKRTSQDLLDAFSIIETEAKKEYKVFDTRKDTALYFVTCKHPGVLFAILDGKDYAPIIWKQLRPIFCKPFSNVNLENQK